MGLQKSQCGMVGGDRQIGKTVESTNGENVRESVYALAREVRQ
jgi:hypothetical protein